MRGWGLLIFFVFLSGCNVEHKVNDIEADAYIDATIPTEVVEQYGMLQLEKKLPHLSSTRNKNGSISVLLYEQEVEQIEREVRGIFTQYERAIAQKMTNRIVDITYDARYQSIYFYVEDEAVIHDENFLLTEELLMKHALAYQLIHEEKLGIEVLYYDELGEHMLSKKNIPMRVSVSN